MMDALHIIGRNEGSIASWQMSIRGVLILFAAVALVRLGGKRIFGKYSSFDIVLGVMLGSILGRNGIISFVT